MKIKTTTTYVADDGKEFSNKDACLKYEESQKKYKYVVVYTDYDLNTKKYRNKTCFKFEYKKDKFNYLTVRDLVDYYLSNILGYPVLFSYEHNCYYKQYSFEIGNATKELEETDSKFYDITNEIYNIPTKSEAQTIHDMINEWYRKNMK